MTEYYTEVTTAHGVSNRNMTGKIDAVRKSVLKRIKELKGYGGYVHIKTARGWEQLGVIRYEDALGKYVWISNEKWYSLSPNGSITKIEW